MKMIALGRMLLCIAFVKVTAGRVASFPRSRLRKKAQIGARGGHYKYRAPSLRHRQLPHPMHHGHGGTSYLGCLNYTSTELKSEWKFSGSAPDCSYYSYGSNGDDDDGSGGGGGDDDGKGGNDDHNENSGEGDDDKGNDDQYKNGGGDDDKNNGGDDAVAQDRADDDDDDEYNDDNQGANDDAGGGNGNGNDGRNGGDEYKYDDGYEVNNEDVAEGNDGDENPMMAFSITECETYENLWVWDLAFSCDSDKSLENCECTFTEQLMQQEMITCSDIERCPKECPVCETCFRLVGCAPIPGIIEQTTGISTSTIIAIFAAVGLFLFGICYYFCRNRKNGEDEDSLEAQLLEKDPRKTIEKVPPPVSQEKEEKRQYDPETMLGPYPDVPDFRSDLSSLDSRSIGSGQPSPPRNADADADANGVPEHISVARSQKSVKTTPVADRTPENAEKTKPTRAGQSTATESETSLCASNSSTPDVASETVPEADQATPGEKTGTGAANTTTVLVGAAAMSSTAASATVTPLLSGFTTTPAAGCAVVARTEIVPVAGVEKSGIGAGGAATALVGGAAVASAAHTKVSSLHSGSSTTPDRAENTAAITHLASGDTTGMGAGTAVTTLVGGAAVSNAAAATNITPLLSGTTATQVAAGAPVSTAIVPLPSGTKSGTEAGAAETAPVAGAAAPNAAAATKVTSLLSGTTATPVAATATASTAATPLVTGTSATAIAGGTAAPNATAAAKVTSLLSGMTTSTVAGIAAAGTALASKASTLKSKTSQSAIAAQPQGSGNLPASTTTYSPSSSTAPKIPVLGMSVRKKKEVQEAAKPLPETGSDSDPTSSTSNEIINDTANKQSKTNEIVSMASVESNYDISTKQSDIESQSLSQNLTYNTSYGSAYEEETGESRSSDSSGESATPWIGDIDLSYTEPSFEDDDDKESDNHSEAKDASLVTGTEESNGGINKTSAATGGPVKVWLAPLEDLESVQDSEQPLNEAVNTEAEAEPPAVWLAPAAPPGVLAPEPKDDKSEASSCGNDAGPWLAPI